MKATPPVRKASRRPLPAAFYDRPTEDVARELLGAILEHRTRDGVVRGRIVETEAYLGPHDPACHAAAGLTARTRALHGPPGTAYVYFIYGMHWCFNAVTREEGHGSAVLIRAVEPLDGIQLMRRRRRVERDRELTSGPARLCDAFGITRVQDGAALYRGPLRILAGDSVPDEEVVVGPRIGIRKAADWPLRFFVRGSRFVSNQVAKLPRCQEKTEGELSLTPLATIQRGNLVTDSQNFSIELPKL